jgi:hypothetical protein
VSVGSTEFDDGRHGVHVTVHEDVLESVGTPQSAIGLASSLLAAAAWVMEHNDPGVIAGES